MSKIVGFLKYFFGLGFLEDFRAGQEEYIKDYCECRALLMRTSFNDQMRKVVDEEDGQQLVD